jgi:NAD(P)-dependent dehydrogenase (short-subunit alcohol dehydrogenase family)
MSKLEGKIALITGGNSGIGLATAKQFVNEGAYVFITGRRDPELAAAVKEIGRNVTGVQGDVSNLGDLDRLFAQINRVKGKLDCVFANAGIARYAPLGKITEDLYDSIFNVNVKGLLFHGAEGASAAAGWCLHHSECVHRRQQRVVVE